MSKCCDSCDKIKFCLRGLHQLADNVHTHYVCSEYPLSISDYKAAELKRLKARMGFELFGDVETDPAHDKAVDKAAKDYFEKQTKLSFDSVK